ncbi:MAG: DUF2207 domain-containing protein, partial [Armatimonadota bacterium]|nr:DUF2207 domain-containing protein [Armatimonadota bacterium]
MRRLALLVFLLVVFLLVLTALPAWTKAYDHPLVEQTFRLLPTGEAEVEEVRAFRFDGAFSWATITRTIRGQYGRYTLDYHSVWDVDTGQSYPFQVTREGDDVTLRWTYAARDATTRFLIRYRIGGAVQRYGDVAQFYWQAVEGDHAPIDRVRITILPPAPSLALFKVFVHSRAAPGSLELAPDGSRAVVTQRGIPETSFLEIRALLDPAIFPRARVQSGQTYESLLQDERRQAGRELRLRRLFLLGIGLAALVTLLLVVGYIWTYRRYGQEPPVAYDALYEREPPRPLPPAVVPAIMTQGKVNRNDLPRA